MSHEDELARLRKALKRAEGTLHHIEGAAERLASMSPHSVRAQEEARGVLRYVREYRESAKGRRE